MRSSYFDYSYTVTRHKNWGGEWFNVWTVYGRHEDGRALALHDAPQPDQAAAWLAAQLARD